MVVFCLWFPTGVPPAYGASLRSASMARHTISSLRSIGIYVSARCKCFYGYRPGDRRPYTRFVDKASPTPDGAVLRVHPLEDRWPEEIRTRLEAKKAELTARLERVKQNVRRRLDSDSEERAQQLEDSEVIDALGNETRKELHKINAALKRMADDEYGICEECDDAIGAERLKAHPYARKCIDCASLDEEVRRRS